MKKITLGYLAAFALLCVLPLGLRLAGVGTEGSAAFEKREMSPRPVLSETGISAYPQAYEAYFDDSVPFRTAMIRANSRINFALLSGSSSMQLIQGREGWLFYNPGGSDGDPIADYYLSDPFSEEDLAQIRDRLLTVRQQLEADGRQFLLYICPNKETLYGSAYFPVYYPRNDGQTKAGQLTDYLAAETDLPMIYTHDLVRQWEQRYPRFAPMYYRQDTHWNTLGGYLGASAMLEALGIPMPEPEALTVTETVSQYRDLAELSTLTDLLEPERDWAVSGYTDRTFTREEDPERGIIRTACPGADPRKILLIRDSFCIAMMDVLASQFEECVFITHDSYLPRCIAEEDPDIVVFESVERYISSLSHFRVD